MSTRQSHRPAKPRQGSGPEERPPTPGGDDDRGRRWRRPSRTQTFWILSLVGLVLAARFLGSVPGDERVVSYKEYRDYLRTGQIAQATIVGADEFHGVLRDGRAFSVSLGPIDAATKLEWEAQGIDFRFRERPFQWYDLLLSILPWLLMVAFSIFLLRQMQGGPRGLFSFGKSRARLLTEDKHQTTFSDVAGADEAKQELEEIIEFLKDPHKFQRLGGRIPKGVLMVGPPGTGKTHLARAVAGEAGVPFFSISGSDFVEMFVGVGASRVRDLFEQGKASAPCIVFIDEIDAVGRHRGAGIGGGHDEREQTLNQLLVEMDGFESNDGVILIAATNRPDVLDPALLRPGRFDRRVVVDLPDVRGREGILKVHSRKVPLGDDVDLKRVAQGAPGLSGADLANLVNEAALLASRRGLPAVTMADFEEAKDKVMLGAERRSLVMTDEDRRLSAFHEAGHALVAKRLPGAQPIHKATIIPRGQAMGMVSFLADERRSVTETRLRAHLATALGGCCAERLVFNERSTGAQGDYQQVTALARSMVCDWGMNGDLGPLSFGSEADEIFVGREWGRRRTYSDRTAEAIDREVRQLVLDAEQTALSLLREHAEGLQILAAALLEFEVLDDEEIGAILAGRTLTRLARPRPGAADAAVAAPTASTGTAASAPETGAANTSLPGAPAAANQTGADSVPPAPAMTAADDTHGAGPPPAGAS